MHLNPRHRLRALPPLLLSFALGCSGPAPEQDAPSSQTRTQRLSSATGPPLPPGLAPSRVKDIQPGIDPQSQTEDSSLAELPIVTLGPVAYFVAQDENASPTLWKTDGTPEGTLRVRQFVTSTESRGFIRELATVGDSLYLVAEDENLGTALWKSDGTPEGTVLVADIAPGAPSAILTAPQVQQRPSRLYAVDGVLYFAADDGVHGTEPWKSDGTAAGTVLLRDVLPGPEDSGAGLTPFVPAGNHGAVAFSASDGVSGLELWTTDGTPEGTRRFADLFPGPGGAAPLQLTVSGSRLFFVADEGEHGRELWNVKQAAFQHQP